MRLGDRPVAVGHPRQRCVLAVLLYEANHPVPAERLIERVWADEATDGARATLHTYLSRLRKALAGAPDVRIGRRAGGYTLLVDPLSVDIHRMRHLLVQAGRADDDTAMGLLEEAADLARDDFCAGTDTPWLASVRATVDEQRVTAACDLVDLKLRHGRHTEVLAELAARTARLPLDERVAGQYMVALTRGGRQADALEFYRGFRTRLVGDLGTDPGPELRELHQRILVADPALLTAPRAAATLPTPRQLPAPPNGFTGRADALARIGALGTPVIAVTGGGGVGKTWLVSRWAHDHLDAFPDGQLFVDLEGFSGRPLPPAVAVRGLLHSLGVAPAAVPDEQQARIGLYRSLVSGKRMLIVLDDARDTAQVAPLLPGSPTCVVLVTSRHQLTGLATGHGAGLVDLGVLPASEALELLRRRAGAGRVDAEPEAAAELVERCGRLPLALGITAARAAAHPAFPLAALAAELADESGRLDALATGEPAGSVRRVLAGSCRVLDGPAATLLGLLGVTPGPDIGVAAAGRLLDVPPGRAHVLLRDLLAVHLVDEREPGRYQLHDLVRLHAAEHADQSIVDTAVRRLAGFYLRTAAGAADTLLGGEHSPFSTYAEALSWLETERRNLLALAQDDRLQVGGQLSQTLRHYLDLRGYHDDARCLHTAALVSARDAGDDRGEAGALHALGLVSWRRGWYVDAARRFEAAAEVAHRHRHVDIEGYAQHLLGCTATRLGRYTDAVEHHRRGLALAREIGDSDIEGCNLDNLGMVYWYLDDLGRAADFSEQGLKLAERAGNLHVKAHALNNFGLIHCRDGAPARAREMFTRALTLARSSGNRYVESNALNGLGVAHHRLGDLPVAREHLQHALDVARTAGNRSHEAETLNNLGDLSRGTGDAGTAVEYHHRALATSVTTREPFEQAVAHHRLGDAYDDLGDRRRARHHWKVACTVRAGLGVGPGSVR
ncbi:AfsR/SARP family transcriptional regulator [Amycolatopsis suaedae]|nr:BTAD domain-containing putative transcriptional regulator [Amycolatopsis suaedae]